jgi:hypothetical protein
MDSLLKEHELSWEDVETYLNYRFLFKDSEGWMEDGQNFNMNANDGKFYKLNGFILNKSDNSIELLLEKPSILSYIGLSNERALFSWEDISTVFTNLDEIGPGFFSLDQIDEKLNLNPFQKFTYEPKCLKSSLILSTLFHADYLLKQLAMGTEVSSKAPFKQRDIKKGNYYKGLDESVVEKLKPVHERGTKYYKCGRFWIQADELEYDLDETSTQIKVVSDK